MDVRKDDFFDEPNEKEVPTVALNEETPENTTEERLRVVLHSDPSIVKLPFPDKDFNEDGRVKKLRPRMFFKLVKCEMKYYLPILLTVVSIVLIAGLFFGFSLKLMMAAIEKAEMSNIRRVPDELVLAVIFSAMFYVFCCYAAIFFMQVFPVARYNKNFFKSEGYLTFSIPASAEEHVAAKRVGAIICSACAFVAVGVSLFLVLLITGSMQGFFDGVWEFITSLYGLDEVGLHATLFVIEMVLSMVIGVVLTPCLYGAMSCLLSKITGGMKLFLVILMVVGIVGGVESVISYMAVFGVTPWAMSLTLTGLHIMLWLTILVQLAATIGCICFEIHYIKKKKDLK